MIDLNAAFPQITSMLSQVMKKYPHRCSIIRPTSTTTAYRTQTPGEPLTIASNVGCAYGPGGKEAKEYLSREKIVATAPYTVDMPAQIDEVALELKAKDQIVIVNGPTFEVLGPPLNNGGLSLFVVCTFEE